MENTNGRIQNALIILTLKLKNEVNLKDSLFYYNMTYLTIIFLLIVPNL